MTVLSRPRRFIQYNDIVFEGTKSINSSPSETITTKYSSSEYLLRNGSYVYTMDDQVLIKEDKISLELSIPTYDWNMEHVQAHQDFIKDNLLRRGKLWAIDTGGQLIWCNAILDSYSPVYEWHITNDSRLVFTVEFTNPEAVWYKADGYTTWLVDYGSCSFVNMLAECFQNATCDAFCNPARTGIGFCEGCGLACCDLKDAFSLCELSDELYKDFFDECNGKWRIVHNCEYGRDIFGDEKLWGQAFCDTCIDGIFTESFYADTVVKSKNITMTMQGTFENPTIQIGDTMVRLEGKFDDGYLQLSSDGTVLTFSDPFQLRCNEAKEISSNVLTLCDDDWWTIERGYNQVIVRGITSEHFCIWLNFERITY